MKKIIYIVFGILAMVACQESLQDRAERETKEYSKKNCPRAINQMMVLDSMTFDKATSTFYHYYTISGASDDREHFEKNKEEMRKGLIKELHDNTSLRVYKDAGFCYRYVMYAKSDGSVLFDTTLKKEDYL